MLANRAFNGAPEIGLNPLRHPRRIEILVQMRADLSAEVFCSGRLAWPFRFRAAVGRAIERPTGALGGSDFGRSPAPVLCLDRR